MFCDMSRNIYINFCIKIFFSQDRVSDEYKWDNYVYQGHTDSIPMIEEMTSREMNIPAQSLDVGVVATSSCKCYYQQQFYWIIAR